MLSGSGLKAISGLYEFPKIPSLPTPHSAEVVRMQRFRALFLRSAPTPRPSLSSDHTPPTILHCLYLPSPLFPLLLPALPQRLLAHRGTFCPASAPHCLTWFGRRQEVGRAALGWRRLPGGRLGALAGAPCPRRWGTTPSSRRHRNSGSPFCDFGSERTWT